VPGRPEEAPVVGHALPEVEREVRGVLALREGRRLQAIGTGRPAAAGEDLEREGEHEPRQHGLHRGGRGEARARAARECTGCEQGARHGGRPPLAVVEHGAGERVAQRILALQEVLEAAVPAREHEEGGERHGRRREQRADAGEGPREVAPEVPEQRERARARVATPCVPRRGGEEDDEEDEAKRARHPGSGSRRRHRSPAA
jgi:hypothetical protein